MSQIKSKKRVADHGEVLTNEREVKAMVDLVWKEFPKKFPKEKKLTTTYFEPSCGTGNFLVEILERKLKVLPTFKRKQDEHDCYLILLVGSIYGIELLEDNTNECRERLFAIVKDYYHKYYAKVNPRSKYYKNLMKAIEIVIIQNIQCGNTLEDTHKIVFTFWKYERKNQISRVKQSLASIISSQKKKNESELFSNEDFQPPETFGAVPYEEIINIKDIPETEKNLITEYRKNKK